MNEATEIPRAENPIRNHIISWMDEHDEVVNAMMNHGISKDTAYILLILTGIDNTLAEINEK